MKPITPLFTSSFLMEAPNLPGHCTPVVRYSDHCARVQELEQLRANAVRRCVTVYPHGELGLRQASGRGCRVEYKIGLPDVWRMAVQITTLKFATKVREYKKSMTLKEARRRARKELGL